MIGGADPTLDSGDMLKTINDLGRAASITGWTPPRVSEAKDQTILRTPDRCTMPSALAQQFIAHFPCVTVSWSGGETTLTFEIEDINANNQESTLVDAGDELLAILAGGAPTTTAAGVKPEGSSSSSSGPVAAATSGEATVSGAVGPDATEVAKAGNAG
jgi:hypothetical protein